MTKRRKAIGYGGIRIEGNYSSTTNYMAAWGATDEYGNTWVSRKDNNKGHALPKIVDGVPQNNEWWKCMINLQSTSDAANEAKIQAQAAKSNASNAKLMADAAQEQARQAQIKGENAEAMAKYAKLMADNPPKTGKALGKGSDDMYWYFFVPNADYSGGVYVKSDSWSKGDNLDWNTMSEVDKQNVIDSVKDEILEKVLVEDVTEDTIEGWIDNA